MQQGFSHSSSFNQSLEGHWQGLYRVCFSWCHDPQLAADLVQETLHSALKNKAKLKDAEHLKKWLYKVMVNKWHDHCRQYKQQVSLDDITLIDDGSPENDHHYNEVVSRMYKAMSLLVPEQREVLSLVALEGFSYEQVANILDIPAGTVMSRLCRSRKQLKIHLQKMDAHDAPGINIRRVK